MSENKVSICPCCPRGCDLSNPRCSRGEEYLLTGIVPEKGNRNHHHEEHRHPNYEEMNIDEKLFALLGKLGHMSHSTFNGKSSQNRILRILSKSERMTQRELTEQLGIQPGSVSEIIKKLESAGLITRQGNTQDRRTVDIALTDAGKAQAEASSAQYANHDMFKSLTNDEKQQLLSLLEKVSKDWHHRFRGEHRHHGEGGREHRHGNEKEHRPKGKHGHKPHHDSI